MTIQIALGAGILALLFAWWKSSWINRLDAGTEHMREIGAAVREGAMAFLGREYKVLSIFVVAVAILLVVGNWRDGAQLTALSFVVGALCSSLAGFFGMRVATAANMRTTNAARSSLAAALGVAFSGGAVMGMCVVGLGIIGLAGAFPAVSKSACLHVARGWKRAGLRVAHPFGIRYGS